MTQPDRRPALSVRELATLVDLDHRASSVSVGERVLVVPDDPSATAVLTAWLYGQVHAGNPDVFATASVLPDVEFEHLVRDSLPDPGLLVPVETRQGGGDDGVVELHRVLLRLPDGVRAAQRGTVRLPCLRPALSPGFFMFVHDSDTVVGQAPLVRYYLSSGDPRAALTTWVDCLQALVASGSGFRSKILSRRTAYPRNDALVFYAREEDPSVLQTLAGVLGSSGEPRPGSPLCASVGPGIGMADEPVDLRVGAGRQSYGQHRCAMVAEAVVESLASGTTLVDVLHRTAQAANVDPDDVSRNAVRTALGVPA